MMTQRGFTLIEMAIVLIIVTILIGGLAVPLSAQIQARRIAETNKTLGEVREAIMGYAMSHIAVSPIVNSPITCDCEYILDSFTSTYVRHQPSPPPPQSCPVLLCPPTALSGETLHLPIERHYLPCPDLNGTDPEPGVDNDGDGDPTNDRNNGREDRSAAGTCSNDSGNLPWVTLGTGHQDAWGNLLHYTVTSTFANISTGFSNADTGDLQICDLSANTGASDCGALGNVASNIPMVIVSYGPNGWGARNINGNKLADPSSNNEKENANSATVDKEFVSRSPSKAGDVAGEFDDLVEWISADQLRGRICPAGGCP
jgi:prepilin-type N-terminal cleavage/methylation domain-containing protein